MLPRSLLAAVLATLLTAAPAAAQIPMVVPTIVPGLLSQGPGAQPYQQVNEIQSRAPR
jgi:hypothetical protein